MLYRLTMMKLTHNGLRIPALHLQLLEPLVCLVPELNGKVTLDRLTMMKLLTTVGRKAQVKGKRPREDLGTFDCDEGRKAQVKRKRPCEDLGESSSATAAASGTEAQVTEEDEEFFTKNRHPYDVYPYPDIVYQYEGTRLVQKVFFPPSRLNYVRLVKRRGPITPEEAAIKEPYYHHLVASGWGKLFWLMISSVCYSKKKKNYLPPPPPQSVIGSYGGYYK
ncbi:hypothetical protein HanPSC8_Chr10g0446311 [Helianthus annuus]|nr:hypothetical protein HanPSC8_Chr10g0446311 [Helianthus annuus]